MARGQALVVLISLGLGSLCDAQLPPLPPPGLSASLKVQTPTAAPPLANGNPTSPTSGLPAPVVEKPQPQFLPTQQNPQLTPPADMENSCRYTMDRCQTVDTAAAAGAGAIVTCQAFDLYQKCFNANRYKCTGVEVEAYNEKFNKIVANLPVGCQVSTTPLDFSPFIQSSADGRSSSDFTFPNSGSYSGRASGSSGLYANWWQWIVILCCCCCVCGGCGGGAMHLGGRRKRGYPGAYGQPQYGYEAEGMYADDVNPLMGGPMPYTANMPTQMNMIQPGYVV